MSGLWRDERRPVTELARPAQVFLAAVRSGEDEQAAARAAGVTLLEARTWRRDPDFAHHHRRALRGQGGAQCLHLGSQPAPGEIEAMREDARRRDEEAVRAVASMLDTTPEELLADEA